MRPQPPLLPHLTSAATGAASTNPVVKAAACRALAAAHAQSGPPLRDALERCAANAGGALKAAISGLPPFSPPAAAAALAAASAPLGEPPDARVALFVEGLGAVWVGPGTPPHGIAAADAPGAGAGRAGRRWGVTIQGRP